MDKFDIGVILASATITVHPYVLCALAAIPCLWACFVEARSLNRKAVARRDTRARELRTELVNMFPGPWINIYDNCMKLDNSLARENMLEDWLQGPNAPQLSFEANHKFAKMVVLFHCGYPFTQVLANLKLHQDRMPIIQSSQLPKEWFSFYMELLNYPTRDLFVRKICDQHPCCKISISSEQATLLAKSLARNDKEVELYAKDLVDFVKMEEEKADLEYDSVEKMVNDGGGGPPRFLTLGERRQRS